MRYSANRPKEEAEFGEYPDDSFFKDQPEPASALPFIKGKRRSSMLQSLVEDPSELSQSHNSFGSDSVSDSLLKTSRDSFYSEKMGHESSSEDEAMQ